MNLLNFIKKEKRDNKVLENSCIDLFGTIGSSRTNLSGLLELFNKAYKEDPKLALKILMYGRDIRGGLGERSAFRVIFKSLCKSHPSVARELLPYVSEIGRYDDMFVGLFTPIEDDVVALVYKKLSEDLKALADGKHISLLAKWMPSINASNNESIILAKRLARKLHMNDAQYRRMLSELRKGLPKACNMKVNDGFNTDKKVSGKMEPLNDLIMVARDFFDARNMNNDREMELETRWENIDKRVGVENTLVVRDGSSSMICNDGLPLSIANSFTIYFSELLKGKFKNKFVTFTKEPHLIELKSKGVYGKLNELSMYNSASYIDISKVYKILVDLYKCGVETNEVIKRILIISDVDFAIGVEGDNSFDVFEKEFDMLGVCMPEIVYWNVNSKNTRFVKDSILKNIKYINGISNEIIESLIQGGDIDNINYINNVVSKYSYVDNFNVNE